MLFYSFGIGKKIGHKKPHYGQFDDSKKGIALSPLPGHIKSSVVEMSDAERPKTKPVERIDIDHAIGKRETQGGLAHQTIGEY